MAWAKAHTGWRGYNSPWVQFTDHRYGKHHADTGVVPQRVNLYPQSRASPAATLFLNGIRRSIAVGIPSLVGDHIDVRVGATVLRIAGADFEYSSGPARFIDQMMPIGIPTPERGAVPGAQCFFAGVGDERQLTLEHPDKLVLVAVPVTLAGPSPRPDGR